VKPGVSERYISIDEKSESRSHSAFYLKARGAGDPENSQLLKTIKRLLQHGIIYAES
jgi:hypothetical protein